VLEAVSNRKYPSEDPPSRDDTVYEAPFYLDPEEYFSRRFVSVEESVAFEKASLCMHNCQLPVDIVKRVMASNVKELQDNTVDCVKGCPAKYVVQTKN
jgi:hypothetical protein